MNYIMGTFSGHDSSYCVLNENGQIIEHLEAERHFREKEKKCDAIEFMFNKFPDHQNIKYHTTSYPLSKTTQHKQSWEKLQKILQKNNGKSFVFGHHLSHCANAFFSSNFPKATIISFDGGGVESEQNFASACSIYYGEENKIHNIKTFHLNEINIGGLYGRATRYIHKLPAGGWMGSSQGSVMAIASYGNPKRFFNDFWKMLTKDLFVASTRPLSQPQDMSDPSKEVRHAYLSEYRDLIEKEGWQTEADLASGLQAACEEQMKQIIDFALKQSPHKDYLCLSGGVALNCVAAGKIFDWFPQLKGVYMPPVCGDANLSIGSAQYLYHHILDNPRNYTGINSSPYLGKKYSQKEMLNAIEKHRNKIIKKFAIDEDVIDLLDEGKIISIFNGRAESGKRALLNRSILADPRKENMRDIINEKVKHRTWYRPSAPTILREEVSNYFEKDVDSPYMSFAIKIKENMRNKIPAVVHVDGTARLQTLTESDNKWAYNFLKKWLEKSGVPVILNTSFNDREPIVELPAHALETFLKTKLDYLYFPELKMLISKK